MQTIEFINWLRNHKNPEKIDGMESYMRHQFKFLGLQAKERRQLARTFLNSEIKEAKSRCDQTDSSKSIVDWNLLYTLWEQPEREFQLIGIDYLKALEDDLVPADFPQLRQLVKTKSWWDTVDFLAKNIGKMVQKEPTLIDDMYRWSLEDNIWIRRVSILQQLSLKDETNTDLLAAVILNNVSDEKFFIKKAIGWALREYAKTDEEWVRRFIARHKEELSALSYREATKNLN